MTSTEPTPPINPKPYTTPIFRANPAEITTTGQQYDNLSLTAQPLQQYIDKWIELDFIDAPLFSKLREVIKMAHDKLSDNGKKLNELIKASADELVAVANDYAAMDEQTAARIDNGYPEKSSDI